LSPVERPWTGDEIVATISRFARNIKGLQMASGVGVGVAATVMNGGVLETGMTTLPGLGGYPLQQRLEEALGKPCLVNNDSNLTLLAEAHYGAARGFKNVLLLTLGTGIGGGLLLDGRMRCGSHSSSAEIGINLVQDLSGRYVPAESIASPGALMQRLGEPRGLLFERALAGDAASQQILNEMYEILAVLITNTHLLLDLDLVLLGGGLAAAGRVLRDGLQLAFERTCPPGLQFGLRIELGELPADSAGVTGAACQWFERLGWVDPLYC
jgi:glucokinase